MKKWIIVIAVCVILLVAGAYIYMRSAKTEWEDSMEGSGPLNTMELDEASLKNDGKHALYISFPKDVKFSYNIFITEGSMQLSFYVNGVKCHEETLGVGEHTAETEVFSVDEGDVEIRYEASDDVQGRYSVKVCTRETKWNRYKRRLYERSH